MDQVVNNNTMLEMEAQLHRLVKAVNDAIDAAAKEIKKSTQEAFTEVRNKLDYVYNIILQRVPKSASA